jgi:hypothetical protein
MRKRSACLLASGFGIKLEMQGPGSDAEWARQDDIPGRAIALVLFVAAALWPTGPDEFKTGLIGPVTYGLFAASALTSRGDAD